MAKIDVYAPGSFCWFELATSDQAAAKSFYAALFGWGANDLPMGPGDFYTMFTLEGGSTGAAFTLRPEMKAQGVPPFWGIYVNVKSADDAAAQVAAAGGKILQPPFDVFDAGRMAPVMDPTGAAFTVWEPKSHMGSATTAIPGCFCWAELNTPDIPKASKFYTDVFGWQIAPGDDAGYLRIKNDGRDIAGIPPANHQNPKVPAHWLLYFYVADAAASSAKVKELGGKVFMGPMEIPEIGSVSIVSDPQGAVFALFQPLTK